MKRSTLIIWNILLSAGAVASSTDDEMVLAVSQFADILKDSDQSTHCISRHVREAIHLNHSRSADYFQLSNGRSKFISDTLVIMERLTLPTLIPIEGAATVYQKNGIPIFCLDLVPMSGAKEFTENKVPPNGHYQPFDGFGLSSKLTRSILTGEDEKTERLLQQSLDALNKNPEYNCFTRHLVESILRSSRLAPIYRRMSAEKGLRDPILLIRTYTFSQISVLGLASGIDARASKLNAEGIKIICNDLPYIETDLKKIFTTNP